jgi:anti-sigma-K factor RskA
MKEFKARAKVERRMTNDEGQSRGGQQSTGEISNIISKREAEAALGGSGVAGQLHSGGRGSAIAKKTVAFVWRHWRLAFVVLAIVGIFALCFTAFSSCGAMLQGGFPSVITTAYTSEDSDIEQVDRDYTAKATALSNRVNNIEGEYPGYDEYRYELAEIGHDPFELASLQAT